ncbi:AraC family transcriptional regulator [Aeromonas caviae]|uniref:AraC family transcriptional regulator n=1 Tax=Aeromonas caviae TaxID=648 RepID=UPI001EF12146|nr:AraC family transcriptional regulator [Aeromonas caviae]ULH03342.1 AraC family transcriptional regulator [Aeromonas caviae]WDV30153.1 AraC family transcriptional regulator [Aeromonas caviae]
MQGVPVNFTHQHDRADFRALPGQPATELYRAHIQHHIFDPHSHEGFGLGVIECGAERFRYRGSQLLAGPGSLVLMNPDELHTGESACEQGWRYRMLYLPADRLEAISGERDWYFTDAVRSDPRTAPVLQAALDALWHCDSELAADGLLLRVCETLRPHARALAVPREAAHPLGRAIDYMQACFARPITLAELAGSVNLSPYHFQRSFKARFHVTPQQMLMAIRLQRAKGWLAAGLPAAEVAAACGLADQSHLNRAFLRRYGTTPVRYQKQVQAGR